VYFVVVLQVRIIIIAKAKEEYKAGKTAEGAARKSTCMWSRYQKDFSLILLMWNRNRWLVPEHGPFSEVGN